jgi:hypothetical protein
VDFSPSIDFFPTFHQTYFRVKCGHAAFFERCLVFRSANFNGPLGPPDWLLGGDFTPHPSDWLRYPTQGGLGVYWFFGQFRDPASTSWQADAVVGHIYDIYDNGTLSTVQYNDTGGDSDLNDLILEVAIVKREPTNLTEVQGQQAAVQQFERHVAPRLRAEVAKLGSNKPPQ